jgi:hypothetical protein
MVQPNDTTPEARRVQVEVFRGMPVGRKWTLLGYHYLNARFWHAAGVRMRHPGITPEKVQEDWLRTQLRRPELACRSNPRELSPTQNLEDIREVARILTRMNCPWAIGGSVASSLHGISRHTLGANIPAEPFVGREAEFVSAIGEEWYVSGPAVQEANRNRSSFNLINTSTGFKIDVFIRKDDPFEQEALSRRVALHLPDRPDEPLYVMTPEDVVLFKLIWFRMGEGGSDRQWQDVVGVLQVQEGRLDEQYLDHWAHRLGLVELLQKAKQEK